MKNELKHEEDSSRRECKVCKTPFQAKNYWQKYCSKECKLFAYADSQIKKRKSNGNII
jgi:predicted nucleic acid-binding Zn ribbon protein